MVFNKFILLYLPLLIKSNNFENFDCTTCLESGANFCLDSTDFTKGTCCDPKISDEDQSSECGGHICGNLETIQNPILQHFICPANEERCPNERSE